MLARRFTIVCLMTALFGIFFASVVAQPDRPRVAQESAQHLRCALLQLSAC